MGFTGVSLALTAASAASSAYGSMKAGQASAASYQYQAQVAAINKQIADQNADYARAAGEVEAQQQGMKTRYQVGQTIATQGASGLAIGQGSQARVVQSTQEVGAEDAAIIRSNAAKRAYGYEVEGVQETAKGQLDTMASTQAKTAGEIGAFTSLIGGAGSVADKWSKAKTAGIFGGSDGNLAENPVGVVS